MSLYVFKPWFLSLCQLFKVSGVRKLGHWALFSSDYHFFYTCSWRNRDQPERLAIFLRILRICLWQFWSVFLTAYFQVVSWTIKWFLLFLIRVYCFLKKNVSINWKSVNCSVIVCRALWFSWCGKHWQNHKINSVNERNIEASNKSQFLLFFWYDTKSQISTVLISLQCRFVVV